MAEKERVDNSEKTWYTVYKVDAIRTSPKDENLSGQGSMQEPSARNTVGQNKHKMLENKNTDKVKKRARVVPVLVSFFTGGISSLLLLGGFAFYKVNNSVSSVFQDGEETESAPAISTKIESVKKEGDGRINFLLLGIDSTGRTTRTDTIMLASLNPETGHLSMFSIPRDLWVEAKPLKKWAKVNYIYRESELEKRGTGGSNMKKVIGDLLDINVHYYVKIDWRGFTKMIDHLGGVTVDVPYRLYDANGIDIPQGVQHLDGQKALDLVRCRKNTCKRDFGRSGMQQLLIKALSQKIQKEKIYLKPLTIFKVMDAISNHIRMDVGRDEIMDFLDLAQRVNTKSIESRVLGDGYGGMLRSGWEVPYGNVLKPRTGNFEEIRKYVHEILDDPNLSKEHAKIEIRDATSDPVKFNQLARKLKSYGYNIIGKSRSSERFKSSVIFSYTGSKKYTLRYLALRFDATTVTEKRPKGTKADIVLIVGDNDLE